MTQAKSSIHSIFIQRSVAQQHANKTEYISSKFNLPPTISHHSPYIHDTCEYEPISSTSDVTMDVAKWNSPTT
eukprot:m.285239 g.285239  ORF g.285239 m.285239 type:complete len:73 (-) comp15772_c0_seq3:1641-1859(-)